MHRELLCLQTQKGELAVSSFAESLQITTAHDEASASYEANMTHVILNEAQARQLVDTLQAWLLSK